MELFSDPSILTSYCYIFQDEVKSHCFCWKKITKLLLLIRNHNLTVLTEIFIVSKKEKTSEL